jgi:hypothetical protein
MSGKLHAPTALPQGKIFLYPLYRRLDEIRAVVDALGKRKCIAPAENRNKAIQPVGRHYTV